MPRGHPLYSRSVQRRALRRQHIHELAEEATVALNEMYTGGHSADRIPRSANAAQRASLQRIVSACGAMGSPPAELNGQGALKELLGKRGYDGEPSALAPLDVDSLALPGSGFQPVSIEAAGGEGGRKIVERLLQKVLPSQAAQEKEIQSGVRRPYSDPVLRNRPRVYARFLRRCRDAGLLEYRHSCRKKVGAFAVWKKNGEQRLVIDARIANCSFEDSDAVHLATGQSFGAIEAEEGPPIWVGGVDIAVAFYAMELPAELREYFGMEQIRANLVGVTEIDGVAVGPRQMVTPVLRVLPMGWTLALWVCQGLHEIIADRVPGISRTNALIDRQPAPSLQPYLHTEYVDNFVALSQKGGPVLKAATDVRDELTAAGLPCHEVECSQGGETLGWSFDERAPTVCVSRKGAWRLRLGLQELLRRGRASGDDLSCIIGHFTFRALIRRELLSCLNACYSFIEQNRHSRCALWASVRRELRWCCALIPFATKDLSAEWSSTVTVFDASWWGRGVLQKKVDPGLVKELGQYSERWRFGRAGEEKALTARESALWHGQSLPQSRSRVPPVPRSVWGGDWCRVSSAPWTRQESQAVLEGRAGVWSINHVARSAQSFGKRHLLLSDAMSFTLAATKGRSSTPAMCRVVRQWSAICLAGFLYPRIRWVPSEHNAGDDGSRGGKSVRAEAARKSHATSLARAFEAWDAWGEFLRTHRATINGDADEEVDRDRAGEPAPPTLGSRAPGERAASAPPSEPGTPEAKAGRGVGGSRGRRSRRSKVSADQPVRPRADRPIRPAQLPREAHGHPRDGGEISGSSARLRDVVQGCSAADGVPERSGRNHRVLPQRGLLRGGAAERGDRAARGAGVLPGRPHARGAGALEEPPRPPGLEAAGAGAVSTPDAMGGRLPAGRAARPQRAVGNGARRGHDVRLHPAAVGDAAPQRGGHRPARSSRAGHGSQVEHPASPTRGGAPLENRRIRREPHPRQPGVRLPPQALHSGQGPNRSASPGVQVHLHRVGAGLPAGRRDAEPAHARSSRALPAKARGGLPRDAHRGAKLERVDEARPMAFRGKREEVREGRAHQPGAQRSAAAASRESGAGRRHRWRPPLEDIVKLGPFPSGFALEIFSGSGHFSRAWRRDPRLRHIPIFEVDIRHHGSHDLLSRRSQQLIRGWLTAGLVRAIWLGTPCTSFSRARESGPPGPPPLRSNECPWGLPHLSPKDLAKVKIGNALASFSLSLFHCCRLRGIPCAIENPHTSRLFLLPSFVREHVRGVRDFVTDYCQDNQPWRKRTRFRTVHLDLARAMRRCTGHGICSASGRPHVQLRGTFNGQFRTLIAEPYPMNLCRRLASCFAADLVALKVIRLESYCGARPHSTDVFDFKSV